MKRSHKQCAIAALAVALAAPMALAAPGDISEEALPGRDPLGQVAFLPLDDRPYTWYAPVKLGAGAGYDVQTPGQEVLGRHFEPGDGEAAAEWALEAAEEADDSILALPMLAYGGLLNSRNSSVAQETVLENLEVARTIKEQNPDERLYAFDTIMRLTPEGPWRTPLRNWATVKDEVENLGMEEKRPQLEELEAEIPEEVREDYLATRQRNHEINLEMIEWAAEGVFDYLVIGQDDASGTGLHRPEAEALQALIDELGVQDRVVLYPGADVVASLLLAKMSVADAGTDPAVYVEYSRVHGAEWTAPYQNIRYEELVTGYVQTIGGHMTEEIDDADIVLMANTGGNSASVAPFAERLVSYVEEGRNVAVGDDAIAGRSDMRLFNLVDPEIARGELAAYSGWNIGIPISQAMSRDAFLHRAEEGELPPGAAAREQLLTDAARNNLELTVSEWVQTDSYRNHVRDAATAYASELGEPDPQNIQTYFEEVDNFVRERTTPVAQEMFDEHFAGTAVPMGTLNGVDFTFTATEVAEWNVFLPWLRTGEVAAEPELVYEVEPGPATITASSASAKLVGNATNVWGTAPRLDGERAVAEVRSGDEWVEVGAATVAEGGSYIVPLSGAGVATAGEYTLRVRIGEAVSREFSFQRIARTGFGAADHARVGRTANAWGTVDGQATVSTQVYLPGKGWVTSQTGRTDADGWFVLPLTYGANTPGEYRWRIAVDHAHGEREYTREFVQKRVQEPSAASAGSAPVGRGANVWGSTGVADAPVWTEVYLGAERGWVRSQSATTNASGGYVLPLTYGENAGGTYRFRVGTRNPDLGVLYSAEFAFVRTVR